MAKVFTTLRNNWKKSIFFSGCFLYASKYALKWYNEDLLMKDYCKKAQEFGRQTISASERPRKIVVFLNPAAKDGKTKYLLDKHVLPLLHLAGIEVHVVRTEHEGQAKAYMGVLDNSIVDAIVVAGGDGTLSEIVTGLLRRNDGLAQRVPIGVLPFGSTNTFATRLFPKKDLEVERYCQASMAIINNNIKYADVIEVQPCNSTSPEISETDDAEHSSNKNVYIMSHIKWGVHSDIEKKKVKYWYMPGPLKQYYCYLKQALFGEWPPHVEARLEYSPPCDGCRRCVVPPPTPVVQQAKKSVWWWPTDNRGARSAPPPPDPRLQRENPACGSKHCTEISTPQLELVSVAQSSHADASCSHLELSLSPESATKWKFLTEKLAVQSCTPLSQVTITPKCTEPMYIMDSEKYEVMPATVSLLKNRIKVFAS